MNLEPFHVSNFTDSWTNLIFFHASFVFNQPSSRVSFSLTDSLRFWSFIFILSFAVRVERYNTMDKRPNKEFCRVVLGTILNKNSMKWIKDSSENSDKRFQVSVEPVWQRDFLQLLLVPVIIFSPKLYICWENNS